MKKIIILLSVLLLLTGCWDRMELEEQAFVIAIGLDKVKNKNDVKVTFQIANPQVGSTDRSRAENERPSEIITFTAPDLSVAKQMANISVTRKVVFSHVKVIIVGENLARTGRVLGILEPTTKDRELRRDTVLIVTKEDAADFIRDSKSPLETRPHKFYDLMFRRWEDTGFVPLSTFEKYMRKATHDAGASLTIYGTAEKRKQNENKGEDRYFPGEAKINTQTNTQMIGSAVFKEGKMIGALNGEETRIALLLKHDSEVKEIMSTYKDPKKKGQTIGSRILVEKKPDIKVKLTKPGPTITATVPLKIDIVAIPSLINYSTNAKNRELLEKSIEKQVYEKTEKLIKKSQEKYKIDLFDFYYEGRIKFLTMPDYEKYNWMKRYPDARIKITYDVTFYQFGKQIRPTNLRLIRD